MGRALGQDYGSGPRAFHSPESSISGAGGLSSVMNFLRPWVSLLAMVAFPTFVTADEPAFSPLFNGRDLAGWVNVNCAPETFTVQDGMIHCDGLPTGALRTDRQFENFILELEWRHMKSGGNAGVFIWSGPLPAVGQPFLRAIEVQVLDHGYGKSDWFTTHGDIFPIHGSRMKPFSPSKGDRSFPKEFRSKGTNEWNHYRIVATNGVIRLSVNGAEVSGGTDCSWRKGYIALESEGGIVDWRNLRIQELPSSGASVADTATPAEPWKSLYDGRSLRGWRGAPDATLAWKPSDWNLRCPAAAPSSAILWSDFSAAESHLFLDWRWSAKPARSIPPLVIQAASGGAILPMPEIAVGVGKDWNRVELRRTAKGFDVLVNQTLAGSLEIAPGPVRMGLQPAGVDLSIASPFARLGQP